MRLTLIHKDCTPKKSFDDCIRKVRPVVSRCQTLSYKLCRKPIQIFSILIQFKNAHAVKNYLVLFISCKNSLTNSHLFPLTRPTLISIQTICTSHINNANTTKTTLQITKFMFIPKLSSIEQ